jgi:RNA polymerase sigma factor (sigma-70 family)
VQVDREELIGELEALYRERYRQFLRVAIAVVGDEAGAHDVVQEGFARAIRSAKSYRGEGTLEAWLWQVVLNSARAAKSDRVVELGVDDERFEMARDGAMADDADSGIRAWMASLPERQRLVVFLRYYADLDYRAIGIALGIEVGTVSATLNAAHAALRRSFKEVMQ